MKKILIFALVAVMASAKAFADEGMWMLPFLEKMNIKDMKKRGFKLSAKDIYDVNGNALKDAIVIFGRGCTGEVVSSNGLVLTNHHCGYPAIQQHSSVEHDYLKDGFWAASFAEEIPTPGLQVTYIRGIEDVTDKIVPYVSDKMTEQKRTETVNKLVKRIVAAEMKKEANKGRDIFVKPVFGGNQYIMFNTEVFKDVRLVGAPPSSIGKFGGNTDNWMWPRHTGDFSVFRIYASPDGKPAEYSKDNVPYQAPKHLTISLQGFKKGDYAMIMGFPGSTDRYMTSYEVDQTLRSKNPTRIFVRGERQKLMMEDMNSSDRIRIQYATKYAQSSNYWKNSIGMNKGLIKLNVKGKKQDTEARFRMWVGADSSRKAKYGEALQLIETSVREKTPIEKTMQYYVETMLRGTEIIDMALKAQRMIGKGTDTAGFGKLSAAVGDMYKDFNSPTDRKIAKRMFAIVRDSIAKGDQPAYFKMIDSLFGGNVDKFVDYVYDNSVFATQESLEKFLKNPDRKALKSDPAVILANSALVKYRDLYKKLAPLDASFDRGHRLFIAGLMEMDKDRKFYPDANFTIRLTYGNILPYKAADAVYYDYKTTLSGVMAKEDPTNPNEFTVPAKLKELYKNKDFGPYAENGDVPVAFLSNNDITGGNSGSPVLNNRGQLIGLAFDGNWEAMSGDIAFEPELQRTISVDIRYVLFIIDKFAGSTRLIDEMTIVK